MLESMAQGSSDWSDLSRLPHLGKAQHNTKEADGIESKLLPKDRANSHQYYSVLQEEKLGLCTWRTPSGPCFLLVTYSWRLSSVGAGVAHSLQARQMLCGAQTTRVESYFANSQPNPTVCSRQIGLNPKVCVSNLTPCNLLSFSLAGMEAKQGSSEAPSFLPRPSQRPSS